jgi:hypothetical protein
VALLAGCRRRSRAAQKTANETTGRCPHRCVERLRHGAGFQRECEPASELDEPRAGRGIAGLARSGGTQSLRVGQAVEMSCLDVHTVEAKRIGMALHKVPPASILSERNRRGPGVFRDAGDAIDYGLPMPTRPDLDFGEMELALEAHRQKLPQLPQAQYVS